MYDTVNFRLDKASAGGLDLINHVPQFLDKVNIEAISNGMPWVTGSLSNLNINVRDSSVSISKSSLCKFHHGHNFQELTRQNTKYSIERISDLLHLPFEKANVTRLDFAANMIMDYPEEVYYPYLGEMQYYKRLPHPNGLYFSTKNKTLIIYGKIREQKEKRQTIPQEYKDKYLLRYELRYLRRLPSQLNQSEVLAKHLYDERFYSILLNKWAIEFFKIRFGKSRILSLPPTPKKQELIDNLASLAIQDHGQEWVFALIREAQKTGICNNKQAYDQRSAIRKICSTKKPNEDNEHVDELIAKLQEKVRFQIISL